jgi:hypothetical protein
MVSDDAACPHWRGHQPYPRGQIGLALMTPEIAPTNLNARASPCRFRLVTLSAMIAHVIDHEGPVLDALLARLESAVRPLSSESGN